MARPSQHPMLRRQLQRRFGDDLPDDPRLRAFIEDVAQAYHDADDGRVLLERSLELTSGELFERNQALHEAMAGGDVAIWSCTADGTQLELQGHPLPFVRHAHDSVVVSLRQFLTVVDPDDRAALTEAIERDDERLDLRFWMEDERGRRCLELHACRSVAPTTKYTGIAITVTHQVEAELRRRALADQERLLRLVIDTAPNLIFVKDRAGRFTLVNHAVADVYGTTVAELIGRSDADFNPDASEVERFQRDDLAVMDSLRERVIGEESVTDAAGVTRWLHTVKRPIVGPDGRADFVLGVATDITERKRAELERIRLDDTRRQSERLESLGLLAGGVAHDFNNLLTPILAYAELLKEELADRPDQHEYLDEIHASGVRARDLTTQLLAFGRKQTLSMTAVDLNAEILQLRALLERVLPSNITITADLAPSLPPVTADRTQIHQILMNLAVNARDAMPSGGQLHFATRVERDLAVLTVRDDGHGMDDDTRAQIFEPFFTTKGLGKGTGLGLATVYGVVQQHRGTIEVESAVNHGTTFTIRLVTCARAPSIAPRSPLIRPAAPSARAVVLVVEDDPRVLRLTCTLLGRQQIDVLAAHTPERAIELAREAQGAIDLLLSDVIMPHMNGRQLHRRLVADHGPLPVIFMTGHAQEVLDDHSRNDPDEIVLAKPFTPAALIDAIDRVLATRTGDRSHLAPAAANS